MGGGVIINGYCKVQCSNKYIPKEIKELICHFCVMLFGSDKMYALLKDGGHAEIDTLTMIPSVNIEYKI